MRRFFARVFAMHPRDILVGLAVVWVAVPLGVYAWLRVRDEGMTERMITQLVTQESSGLRKDVLGWLDTNVAPATKRLATVPDDIKSLVDVHVTRLEGLSQAEIRHGVDQVLDTTGTLGINALHVLDARTGDALKEVQAARADLQPVVQATVGLENRYAQLPDQVASSRAWQDIQTEITCVKMDAFGIPRGYGECIKGRITGILGEGIKAGAAIAKHAEPVAASFEKSADAFQGILEVVQQAAHKYLDPHPTTFLGKVSNVFRFLGAVLIAALRGGAI